MTLTPDLSPTPERQLDADEVDLLDLDRWAADGPPHEWFARKRAEPVHAMQSVTDGLTRLFSPHHPLLRTLRNAGMTAVDRFPLLKHRLAQPALR